MGGRGRTGSYINTSVRQSLLLIHINYVYSHWVIHINLELLWQKYADAWRFQPFKVRRALICCCDGVHSPAPASHFGFCPLGDLLHQQREHLWCWVTEPGSISLSWGVIARLDDSAPPLPTFTANMEAACPLCGRKWVCWQLQRQNKCWQSTLTTDELKLWRVCCNFTFLWVQFSIYLVSQHRLKIQTRLEMFPRSQWKRLVSSQTRTVVTDLDATFLNWPQSSKVLYNLQRVFCATNSHVNIFLHVVANNFLLWGLKYLCAI